MDKAFVNLIILVGVLAFGIFFGVDMASKGIEQVNGPIDPQQSSVNAQIDEIKQVVKDEQLVMEHKERMNPSVADEQEAINNRPTHRSLLSRVFQKISLVLHIIADHLIRWIVNGIRAILS